MTIIIIDTETSGLPLGRNADYRDLAKYDNARIVQLSYMICDDTTLETIAMKDFIIKAHDFKINNAQFHGITNEISSNQGIDFSQVSNILYEDLKEATKILAHNADFDMGVIKSELFRHKLWFILYMIESKEVICTMKTTKTLINIKNKYGIKYPSLAELYMYACNEPIQNAHNSKYDVINLHQAIKRLFDEKTWNLTQQL